MYLSAWNPPVIMVRRHSEIWNNVGTTPEKSINPGLNKLLYRWSSYFIWGGRHSWSQCCMMLDCESRPKHHPSVQRRFESNHLPLKLDLHDVCRIQPILSISNSCVLFLVLSSILLVPQTNQAVTVIPWTSLPNTWSPGSANRREQLDPRRTHFWVFRAKGTQVVTVFWKLFPATGKGEVEKDCGLIFNLFTSVSSIGGKW